MNVEENADTPSKPNGARSIDIKDSEAGMPSLSVSRSPASADKSKKSAEGVRKSSSVPYTVREEVVRLPSATAGTPPIPTTSPQWGTTSSPPDLGPPVIKGASPYNTRPEREESNTPPTPDLSGVDDTMEAMDKTPEKESRRDKNDVALREGPNLDTGSPTEDLPNLSESPQDESSSVDNSEPPVLSQSQEQLTNYVTDTNESVEMPRKEADVSYGRETSLNVIDYSMNVTDRPNKSGQMDKSSAARDSSVSSEKNETKISDSSQMQNITDSDDSNRVRAKDDEHVDTEDVSDDEESEDDSEEESEDDIRSPSPSPIHSPEPEGIRSPSPLSPSPNIPMEPIPMEPQVIEPEPSSPDTGSSAPAMIPLHIEDPHVEEEVEKARLVKLKALTGQIDPGNDPQLRRKLEAIHRSRSQSDSGSSAHSPGKDSTHSVPSLGKDSTGEHGKPVSRGTGEDSQRHASKPAPASSSEGTTASRSQQGHSASPPKSGESDEGSGRGDGSHKPTPPSPPKSSTRPIKIIRPAARPPSKEQVASEAASLGLGREKAQDPYVSKAEDQPDRPR